MRKQLKKLILAVSVIFLTTCGIDEYYYLPQVTSVLASPGNAIINLPSISSSSYWAISYSIFYKIYISDYQSSGSITTDNDLRNINTSLLSNYNSLSSVSNPQNTSTIPTVNTFSSLSYYEMEYNNAKVENVLPKTGGTVEINFPTTVWNRDDSPWISLNGGTNINILRSTVFTEKPDSQNYPYFLNSSDSIYYAVADVSSTTTTSGNEDYAYVSMYVVAVGRNPDTFQTIYGKPTFVNVFLIPNY